MLASLNHSQKVIDAIESLNNPDLHSESTLHLMRELHANETALANAVLCHLFDVVCYNVGESCFQDIAPKVDHSKWFVSVVSDSSLDTGVDIPLADCEQNAQALAVHHYKLLDLFYARYADDPQYQTDFECV